MFLSRSYAGTMTSAVFSNATISNSINAGDTGAQESSVIIYSNASANTTITLFKLTASSSSPACAGVFVNFVLRDTIGGSTIPACVSGSFNLAVSWTSSGTGISYATASPVTWTDNVATTGGVTAISVSPTISSGVLTVALVITYTGSTINYRPLSKISSIISTINTWASSINNGDPNIVYTLTQQ